MGRRRTSVVVRAWIAGLVLCTTALILVAGAVPHFHVGDQADDCAVCKATHTVGTLEPLAHVIHAADGAAAVPLACPDAQSFRGSSPCVPRAPPAL